MDKLRIYYRFKGNGVIFITSSGDYDKVKQRFPNANPAKSIFVEYDRNTDFSNYHQQLEHYIFPVLMGSLSPANLKEIKKVEFILMPDEKLTYTINNYEPEVQPVCG